MAPDDALDDALLDRSVRETWAAMFGLEVEGLDAPIAHAERQSCLTAMIQISGDWTGAVLIDFEPPLAKGLTATVLERAPDVVLMDHMRDALGEVVNIVGGYIKQGLPPDAVLSLPTLVTGLDYRLYLPGARPVNRLTYACDGRRFQVTVFQVQDDGAADDPSFARFLSRHP